MAKTWLTKDMTSFLASDYAVLDELLPGYYDFYANHFGLNFRIIPVREEEIYDVSPETKKLFNEVERFWSAKERYADLGVMMKRGVLLEGPAGGGKSTIVRQAINRVVELGGYALKACADDNPEDFIRAIRVRHPNAPLVVVLEDIDSWLEDDEEALLEILDGSSQVENVLFVATTNHLDELPDRISDRPGRFDTILHVGMPSEEVRTKFIASILKLEMTDEKVQSYSADSAIEDKSLAHVKEFVLMKEIYS